MQMDLEERGIFEAVREACEEIFATGPLRGNVSMGDTDRGGRE
jgi:hypothetical protein